MALDKSVHMAEVNLEIAQGLSGPEAWAKVLDRHAGRAEPASARVLNERAHVFMAATGCREFAEAARFAWSGQVPQPPAQLLSGQSIEQFKGWHMRFSEQSKKGEAIPPAAPLSRQDVEQLKAAEMARSAAAGAGRVLLDNVDLATRVTSTMARRHPGLVKGTAAYSRAFSELAREVASE